MLGYPGESTPLQPKERSLDGPSFANDVSQRRFSFTRRDSVVLDDPLVPVETRLRKWLKRMYEWIRIDLWTWEQRFILFSVCLLVLATAGERITYKMAIDRLTPFRTVYVLAVLGISMIIYNVIIFAKRAFTNDIDEGMMAFSARPLMLIAAMDTVIFGIQSISASGVSPTMTVILLHANTPCIVWGSRCAFPGRQYGMLQSRGAQIIAAGIIISISRPILHLIDGENVPYATSTLIYTCASAMQGFVLLYKEKTLAEFGKRMDVYLISAWLFTYQFGIACLLSPFLYLMQDLLSHAHRGFPMSSFLHNMQDGYECVIGTYTRGEEEEEKEEEELYAKEYMDCRANLWLLLGFVVSTVLVLLCINQVLYFRDQILGRSMAVSVLFAFVTLAAYDSTHKYFGGNSLGYADIVSMAVLLIGMEIYGRDKEPDIEVITNYNKPSPLAPGDEAQLEDSSSVPPPPPESPSASGAVNGGKPPSSAAPMSSCAPLPPFDEV